MQENYNDFPLYITKENWNIAKEEYKRLSKFPIEEWQQKSSMPLWLIGVVEWYCSFSTRGFPGGFIGEYNGTGRNYYEERFNNHKKQRDDSLSYNKIIFVNNDYDKMQFNTNSLIYIDPPYSNTTGY